MENPRFRFVLVVVLVLVLVLDFTRDFEDEDDDEKEEEAAFSRFSHRLLTRRRIAEMTFPGSVSRCIRQHRFNRNPQIEDIAHEIDVHSTHPGPAIGGLHDETFAPFALAWLAPGASWVATYEPGSELEHRRLDPGWHVLTHEDLDDVTEPRTRRLRALLQGFEAPSLAQVEGRLLELLALHDQPVEGERGEQPPVCLHAGRMVTVSSALVSFVEGRVTYRHVEGQPCTGWPRDYGHLLPT